MQAFDFTGKSVFVAGGTSGINLGIAEAFAEAGAKLAVASRSQTHVDEAQRQLRVFGGKVVGLSADVRNVEAISAALKTARDLLGEIDILVSGAAGNFPSPALGMSANGFKAVVDIGLSIYAQDDLVEYRGIRYTIRAGIERDHWTIAIHPGDVEGLPKIITGDREQAEARAHSMIDEWLRRHQWR